MASGGGVTLEGVEAVRRPREEPLGERPVACRKVAEPRGEVAQDEGGVMRAGPRLAPLGGSGSLGLEEGESAVERQLGLHVTARSLSSARNGQRGEPECECQDEMTPHVERSARRRTRS